MQAKLPAIDLDLRNIGTVHIEEADFSLLTDLKLPKCTELWMEERLEPYSKDRKIKILTSSQYLVDL